MSAVNFAVIGVGGFAQTHVDAIEHLEQQGLTRLVAIAEHNQDLHREKVERLRDRGVRIYTHSSDLLDAEPDVEAVAIPASLHLHPALTIQSLSADRHVLTEKPPAVIPEDIRAMLDAQARSGKRVGVGFQQISQAHLRMLKRRIQEGALGRIEALVGVGRWKRLDSYYSRNPWAGKIRLGEYWVLDGPINNPLAHLLNDLLFLAGPDMNRMARPLRVRGELYRGHAVEGEDTSCLIAELDSGMSIYYYVTVCAPLEETIHVEVFGTEGHARWELDGHLRLTYRDGRTEQPFLPEDPGGTQRAMFRNFVDVLRGRGELFCPLKETESFVLTSAGAYESAHRILQIPEDHVRRYPEKHSVATEVVDIVHIIDSAAAARGTFSDIGVSWARPTEWFDLEGYKQFSGIEW